MHLRSGRILSNEDLTINMSTAATANISTIGSIPVVNPNSRTSLSNMTSAVGTNALGDPIMSPNRVNANPNPVGSQVLQQLPPPRYSETFRTREDAANAFRQTYANPPPPGVTTGNVSTLVFDMPLSWNNNS